MKKLFLLLMLAVSSSAAVATPIPTSKYNPLQIAFLASCSNIVPEDYATYSISIAHCMGLVRGIRDGHEATYRIYSERKQDVTMWWCVPVGTRDGEVFSSVLTWVKNEPKEYHKIMAMVQSPSAGATLVVIKALNRQYQCGDN